MLTVKVRETRNDSEVVFEAKQVRKYLYPNRPGIGEEERVWTPGPSLNEIRTTLGRIEQGKGSNQEAGLRRALRSIIEQCAQRRNLSASELMESALTDAIPNWREIVLDPAFVAWVRERPDDKATMEANADAITDPFAAADLLQRYRNVADPGAGQAALGHVRETVLFFIAREEAGMPIGEVRCDTATGDITYHIRPCTPADGSDDQTLYVMNAAGATVATYHL